MVVAGDSFHRGEQLPDGPRPDGLQIRRPAPAGAVSEQQAPLALKGAQKKNGQRISMGQLL